MGAGRLRVVIAHGGSTIFKFIIGFEAWGNKTEESILQCRASS